MIKKNIFHNNSLQKESFGSHFLVPSNPNDLEKEKSMWLCKIRMHLLPTIIFLFIFGINSGFIERSNYLNFFLVSLFFSIYTAILFYFKGKLQSKQNIVFAQLCFDVIFFSAFLIISKGLTNPFSAVFLVHAFMGGMLLNWGRGFLFLFLIYLLISVNHLYYKYFYISVPTESSLDLTILIFLCFLSFIIARSLGRNLHFSYQNYNRLKLITEKFDRLRAIGALTAGFSHEFATPLNTIKIRLNRILNSKTIDQHSDDVVELYTALGKCETVLKKINSSQIDFRENIYDEIGLKDYFSNILDVWKQENLDTEISINIPEALLIKIPVVNFTQSILNILDNASDAKSESLQIEIRTQRLDHHLQIIIKDNGPGFNQEVLDRKGEPFNTTKVNGTGLGLYTTNLFLNSLGGYLELESDNGASIKMNIPISSIVNTEEAYE